MHVEGEAGGQVWQWEHRSSRTVVLRETEKEENGVRLVVPGGECMSEGDERRGTRWGSRSVVPADMLCHEGRGG